jgi:predicted kinase
VDQIRTLLGHWQEVEASRLAARHLAAAMAEAHLRNGHDVVVPQYLGRLPFIETLEAIAQQTGSRFREVTLAASEDTTVERFRARRHDLAVAGQDHPQAEVDAREVTKEIADALRRLDAIRTARPGTIVVAATRDVDATYRALDAALATTYR